MGKLPSKPEMRELQEQTDTIVQMLRRRGVLPDLTITDENRRAARQKQHQECFHNTAACASRSSRACARTKQPSNA